MISSAELAKEGLLACPNLLSAKKNNGQTEAHAKTSMAIP
jgi:hypothetical protein